MRNGYVKIYRGFDEDPVFADTIEALLFVDLVVYANWEDGHVSVCGRRIGLKRGQRATTLSTLSRRWNLKKGGVRRRLDKWKKHGLIECSGDTGVTLITVCNYDKYQSSAHGDDTALGTTVDTIGGTTLGTYRKEERNKEVKKGSKAHACPDDFEPNETSIKVAKECGLSNEQLSNLVERMKDYSASAAGSKGLAKDWDARLRNWIRDDKNRIPPKPKDDWQPTYATGRQI